MGRKASKKKAKPSPKKKPTTSKPPASPKTRQRLELASKQKEDENISPEEITETVEGEKKMTNQQQKT